MHYDFPHRITLDEVRAAIARQNAALGTNVFIEADRGDHVIFNYIISFDGIFPFPNTDDAALNREYAILRECRGLTFHKASGRIVARKYAKFFNVAEKAETQINVIDWTTPHLVLEKLDGSMITPVYLGDDLEDIGPEELRWCTKMGITDVAGPVEQWVSRPENFHYARWAAMYIYNGYTPIFEWCSRKQKIVIDYPEDRLVLTAIRNNTTGEYLSYEKMRGAARSKIEIVHASPSSIENIETFMRETYGMEGSEGWVIRFHDGRMYKIKGEWYCQIHKTRDAIQFEKDVIALIANDMIDDAKAFMVAEDIERINRFHEAYERAVTATGDHINSLVAEIKAKVGDTPKAFALEMNSNTYPQDYVSIMFRVSKGADAAADVRKVIATYAHPTAGTQSRIDACRHLFGGLRWEDYRDKSYIQDDG